MSPIYVTNIAEWDTHEKDITDLSDCDFEYHDIILPSYKKGFIKYVDKIKRFRKYHPTVENLLKPGKNVRS